MLFPVFHLPPDSSFGSVSLCMSVSLAVLRVAFWFLACLFLPCFEGFMTSRNLLGFGLFRHHQHSRRHLQQPSASIHPPTTPSFLPRHNSGSTSTAIKVLLDPASQPQCTTPICYQDCYSYNNKQRYRLPLLTSTTTSRTSPSPITCAILNI